MQEYRYGALTVVSEMGPRDLIQQRLKQIDSRLFLERQLTVDEEAVWTVCISVGGDSPPLPLYEYRNEVGMPIPEPGEGIVTAMQTMERSSSRLSARIARKNAALIEKKRSERQYEYMQIAQEMVPLILGEKRPVLHRSQGLRMARDKKRNLGHKI